MEKRIIKFRGYVLNEKRWVYGYYCVERIANFHGTDMKEMHVIKDADIPTLKFFVNPESVGQLTGKFDQKKKEIYEGDIVSLTKTIQNYDDDDGWNPRNHFTPQYSEVLRKGVVFYKPPSFNVNIDCRDWSKFTVIGNIFENPELLN